MNKVTKYINEHMDGNVFDKPSILEAYSTDRSILKITPRFVVTPNSTADIRSVVRFANDLVGRGFRLPITVRGSGLDKTGADLSEGAVISLENMDKVLEVDESSRLVRVQSGVSIGKLNSVLAAYGLTIPIEADPRQTFADLIAGYSLDDISNKYKSIYYYIDRLEVVLSNGELLQTSGRSLHSALRKAGDNPSSFAEHIHRTVAELIDKNFDLIDDIADAPLDFAGYKMISRVSENHLNMNLLPLFFAAQHTLGIVTEVILHAEPLRRESRRLLATFSEFDTVLPFVNILRREDPTSVNIFDGNVVRVAAEHGKTSEIIRPLEKGYYLIASFDDYKLKTNRKLKHCLNYAPSGVDIVIEDSNNSSDFDSIDQLLAQFLNDEEVADRPAILDDVYIPDDDLSDFMSGLKVLEQTYGREMPLIGSIATSLYSVRPEFNLSDVTERKHLLGFLRSYATLVFNHHGSLTGGAPEGRVKGALTVYREREREFYNAIKQAFDPNNILNPEAKLGANLPDIAAHLRTSNTSGIARK